MKKYNFLAFDIGATSGRAVLGTLVGDKFEMQELHRFPNAIMELHGSILGGWISGIWRKTAHCWGYRVRIAILIRTVRRKNISSVFPGRKSTGLPVYRS